MPNSGNGGNGNNAQIQGLEFVIKTISEQAEGIQEIKKNLEGLSDSVQKMPKSLKVLSGLSNSLQKLNAVKLANLNGVINGLNELAKVGRIKARIPERFIDELSVLNIVSQSLKSQTIGDAGRALQTFNGLQLPKIPAGFTNGLVSLNTVSQGVQPDKIQKLGEALQSFNGLEFKDGFSKNMSALSSISTATSQIDTGKLYSLIPALKAFQNLNFNFAPQGTVSALKELVSAGNAVTNDTVNNLYRLSNAVKMFENFNMPNSGAFRELGEALTQFSYFYIPDGFAMSMQYLVDGVKTFEKISEGDIKKVTQLTTLFNHMPAEEMTTFYNVLDSFGSATRDFSELGNMNFTPLKQVLDTVSGMNMAGKTAIAPEFIASVKELLDVSRGMDVGSLTNLLETLLNFGKHGKNFNFSFPTGFANFVKEMKTSMELFPHENPRGWIDFISQLQAIGEVKNIRSVADLFTAFGNIKEISISPDLVTRLQEITDFVKSIEKEDIDKIWDYADALRNLGEASKGVKVPKMEKLKTPEVKETTSGRGGKFQEILSEMPEWASLLTRSFAFIGGSILKGVLWIFKEIGKGALEAAKKIFTLQNALNGLKMLGNIAVAPIKAIHSLDKAIANIPKRVQKFVSHITKAVRSVERFIKNIQKAVKNVRSFLQALGKKFVDPFTNLAKKVTGFIKSLERIAFYRLVRSVIRVISEGFQEGLENLYQYSKLISSDFHKSMDKIATDALYVKNSLAAMVEPLINAVAPVIDAVTDKFVNLLNLVNQTFSALTGKETFTAAKKYATTWVDATKETNKATKDAGDTVKDTLEEIKRYTLAFDELNILGDPNKDNSANKIKNSLKDSDDDDNVKDYLSMFEQRPVEKTISDFFKKIRDAIKNGKFYEVGQMIAEKFNDFIEKIDFGKIGEKLGKKINQAVQLVKGFLDYANFVKVGEGIAEFLNKAIEKINFSTLGEVLAGKIRIAIQVAYGFVRRFNFKAFGDAIGNALTGFIVSIDFGMMAKTIQYGLEGILDVVYGFLQSFQSLALGVKIRNFFEQFETEAIGEKLQLIGEELKRSFSDFFKGLGVDFETNPFEHLGSWLGTQLTNVFYKIPYARLGEILGEGIQWVVANARHFWQNLDLTGLGTGIAELVNNAVANVDFYSVGMTIAEKLSTVFNGIASFLNNVNWSAVFESVSLAVNWFFENLQFDSIDVEKITVPLADAFGKVVSKITDFLIDAFQQRPDALDAVGTALGKMLNSVISNTLRLFDSMKTDDGTDAVVSFFTKIFDEIDNDTLGSLINRIVVDGFAILRQLLEKIDFRAIGATIGEGLGSLNFGEILGEFGGGLWSGITGILKGIDGVVSGRETPFEKLEKKAKDMGMEVYISSAQVSASTSSMVQDFDADSVTWGSICERFQDNFNTGMDEIVKKHQESRENADKEWGLWQESFNETIDGMLHTIEKIKTGFKVMGNSIKESVKNGLNGAIGGVESFANAWITGFNSIADVVNGFSIDIPSWVPNIGGNSWSPNLPKFSEIKLARYEKGGFPSSGDLFFANENGSPELVGRMGNQTAVANQDQIIQGITQGVMMAMNSGSQSQLIRQAITLLQAIAEKDNSVIVTTAQIDKAKNRQNLRNGVLS